VKESLTKGRNSESNFPPFPFFGGFLSLDRVPPFVGKILLRRGDEVSSLACFRRRPGPDLRSSSVWTELSPKEVSQSPFSAFFLFSLMSLFLLPHVGPCVSSERHPGHPDSNFNIFFPNHTANHDFFLCCSVGTPPSPFSFIISLTLDADSYFDKHNTSRPYADLSCRWSFTQKFSSS